MLELLRSGRLRWLLLALFLLVASALIGGGYVLHRRVVNEVLAARGAELSSIGQLKAEQVEDWRRERLLDTRLKALDPLMAAAVVRWLAHPGDRAVAARIGQKLAQERDLHQYRTILLAAPDGRLLMALGPAATEIDAPARDLVRKTAESGQAGFGAAHRAADSGAVLLDIAAPVFDLERRVRAVLLVRTTPEVDLFVLVQAWPTPSRSAESLLVRRDGADAVYLNRPRHSNAPALSLRRPVGGDPVVATRAARGDTGIVRGRDYRGVEVLADLRPVSDSDWTLVAKVDAAEILAEANYRGRVIAGFAGGGIALTALLFAAFVSAQRQEGYLRLYRAERERREALEEFRATLRSIGEAVISTDADGRVRQMNPVAEALTGWREAEAQGRALDEVVRLVDERTRAGVESPVAQVLRQGYVVGFAAHQTLIVARDGAERPIADSGAPVRNEQGETVGVVLVFRDRSAERAAQAQLAASEQRFRATFEQAAVGLAHLAPDGRWLDVNRRLCEILGFTREELLARTWQEITDPADLERNAREARRMLAGEIAMYVTEKRYRGKDGAMIWAQLTAAPVRRADGRPEYVVAVVEDIGGRKRTEEELRKLSRAIEQSSEGIVITDLQARIEYVNEALVRISGYAREELLGRNPRVLQSGRTPPDTYQSMWSALSAGRQWRGEFFNRRKDGSEYVESALVTPIRQADGAITHYVAVKSDITEKRRIAAELDGYRHRLEDLVVERTAEVEVARRQAEAANVAKSAFLANMSHEIRTPMNGVLGTLDVLARGRLSETQADLVRTAQESGRTLLGIIDDILDFSKIEAGRMQIERAPFSVADLVEGLCDGLVALAQRRDVDLSVYVAPQIPERVVADALRLRQVLFNLIGNAIKFSAGRADRRGRVAVRVTVAQPAPLRLAFAVIDNGIGMTPEVVARLFVPFSQAEASTTRRFGGTGLGLTICKRLTELMQGEISVASRPSEGSVFTLALPVEVAADQPLRAVAVAAGRASPESVHDETPPERTIGAAAPLSPAEARARGQLILVAEDDEVSAKVLRSQLELLGRSAQFAADGAEALRLWQAGGHALLLTDLHMPVMDGYELAAAIRAQEAARAPLRRTPIVALTANALRGEAERARTLGIDDYLTKPLRFELLHQTIDRWLGVPGSSDPPAAPPATPDAAIAPAAGAALDLDALKARVGDDPATQGELLRLFLSSVAGQAAELRAATDARAAAAVAHKLKSASRSVGATALGDLCAELEAAGRAADREAIVRQLPAFDARLAQVETEIGRWLSAHGRRQ